MNWHFSIGSIAGIKLFVHWTIFLAPLYVGFLGFRHKVPTPELGLMLLLMVAVFGCVLVHELGHALMARVFAVPTKDIIITPIGGLARLALKPDQPAHEFWITLAGPVVNFAIAFSIGVWIWLTDQEIWPVPRLNATYAFWKLLFWTNVILFAVNLIPAFPMDGGRILRSSLAMWMDYQVATTIAKRIGQIFAYAFLAVGVFYLNFAIIVIGLLLLAATNVD